MTNKIENWRNQYPLNTFTGETRAELEKMIEGIIAPKLSQSDEDLKYKAKQMIDVNSILPELSIDEAIEYLASTLLAKKNTEIADAYTKGRCDEAKTCQGCIGRCEEAVQQEAYLWFNTWYDRKEEKEPFEKWASERLQTLGAEKLSDNN
jgi:hypothetical protein